MWGKTILNQETSSHPEWAASLIKSKFQTGEKQIKEKYSHSEWAPSFIKSKFQTMEKRMARGLVNQHRGDWETG